MSLSERSTELTGKYMTTATEGENEFEHFHRYCLAGDLCQGLDVLVVASGDGSGSSILADVARSVIGVDANPKAIVRAQETYGTKRNLRFVQGSAVELPLGDASVDAAVSFEMLEHFPEQARFVSEIKRVLRPAGRLIVRTPGRALYSAGDESPKKVHAVEFNAAEFESLLLGNFKHLVTNQQVIHGSIIVKQEDGGAWRSYERQSLGSIHATHGLSSAPLLVHFASDEPLLDIPSSVYFDRRPAGEVAKGSLRAPQFRLQGVEPGAESSRAKNGAVVSSTAAEREEQIIWLNNERIRLNNELSARVASLVGLQSQFDKINMSLKWRFINWVVHIPRSAGRLLRWPFGRIAFHGRGRPRGGLRQPLGGQLADSSLSEATLESPSGPAVVLDDQKATILVVAHEATLSGAPILALNLVQKLAARYNVVSLILGGGELVEHFRQASAALYVVEGRQMTDSQLDSEVKRLAKQYALNFAIVNSAASRRALPALAATGIPTVSLVHEFSSNMRPRAALHEVITLSTETVFSTKITFDSAAADFWLYPGTSIHLAPQGKCVVPEAPRVVEALMEKTWLTVNLRPRGAASKFLIIGVGNIELRKGVDLFIQCATILKNQPGGDKFQFVWIGNGFDPENELAYSVYLDDQIKRAGLELQLKILRSTSQIELAYHLADVLLISSRLDPLPNVAIDALLAGRPVVCFEKTTGIADFLIENGLGDQCVANYLDTHDLARKVKVLADSVDLRAWVVKRSRAAAEKEFDMNTYVSKIEAIAMQAVGNKMRVKEEVETILASGKFRSDFFTHAGVEAFPEEKIVQDYLARMARGLGIRKPMPGFQPTVYAALQPAEGRMRGDPFVDFLRKGLPPGPWLQRVIQSGDVRKTATNGEGRVALHLHVFYPDQVAGIVARLNRNASAPDLFISAVRAEAAAEAREALSVYRGQLIDLQIAPNMGRDIGPFLTQFGRALCDSYEIIGHLHTKKSAHVADRPFAEAWNTFLMENLIGGERGGAMLDTILSTMELDPTIGIVFPDDPHVIAWTKNREHAEDLAARMKWGELPEQFNFPVGSMFWIRSSVLAKFVELELAWNDYAPEPLPIDGTIQHAIERLFGVAPTTMGMGSAVTNVRGLTR